MKLQKINGEIETKKKQFFNNLSFLKIWWQKELLWIAYKNKLTALVEKLRKIVAQLKHIVYICPVIKKLTERWKK